MDVGIQVVNAVLRNRVLECGFVLGVVRAATAAIIPGAIRNTVTINIHVGEVSALALEVDDVVVIVMVAAVRVACLPLVGRHPHRAAPLDPQFSKWFLTVIAIFRAQEPVLDDVVALSIRDDGVIQFANAIRDISGGGQCHKGQGRGKLARDHDDRLGCVCLK